MKSSFGPRVRVELVRDDGPTHPEPITTAGDIYKLLRDEARRWDREHFLTIMLDKDHRVLGIEEIAVGSLTGAPVHPREVFKGLILANADAFIAVHNHHGNTTPSREDIAITERLKAAAELLGIRFLDHVIIGPNGYTSFLDDGYLKLP